MSDAVHATHKRFFDLVLRHGSEEEREKVRAALAEMREWRTAFEGSSWEPIEEVTLPGFLISRCKRVAVERQERAKRFSLANQHGVRRTIEQEIRSVEGQYAAAIMLGLPFGQATTHQTARAHGNLGSNCSAFVPKVGHFGLLVDENEKPTRHIFLMSEEATHTFRCLGWCRAGEAMQPEWQRKFWRGNVLSQPYMPPNDILMPLRRWFD